MHPERALDFGLNCGDNAASSIQFSREAVIERILKTLLLLIAITAAEPASAYCEGWEKGGLSYYSVSNEYKRALYVATVRVERETWLGLDGQPKALKGPFQDGASRPWGFDDYMGAYYDVVTVESYKGRPPQRFRLFSENSTARFWLIPGKQFVVFVSRGRFDKPVNAALTVDTCGHSPALRTKANRLVRTLRKLKDLRAIR